MPVTVVPYNPEWKRWFEELRERLAAAIRDPPVQIVHVGSTSVEGMSAKPVIDVDVVLADWRQFSAVKEKLASIGYTHVGDLGIKGREAFKEGEAPVHAHHLYVTQRDEVAYRNHVLLRKHLREDPEAFRRYKELKLRLASDSINVDEYTRAKTDLILEFLEAEGMDEGDAEEIRRQNLS